MRKHLILGIVAAVGVLGVGLLPMLTAAHVQQSEVVGGSREARAHAMQSASCTPSPSDSPERSAKF